MLNSSLVPLVLCISMSADTDTRPSVVDAPARIVPLPVEVRPGNGAFFITSDTLVLADGAAMPEGIKLIDCFAPAMGFRLQLAKASEPRDNAISLRIDESLKDRGGEAYELEITLARITLRAPAPAGLFYGIQSLRQLLGPDIFRKAAVEGKRWTIPAMTIVDYPRFEWRGLMLDTARHFMPKPFVLKLIDVMALHKLNSLQLHLTDDQGWRIEIKKYPKLTEVGAWRDETVIGHAGKKNLTFDGRRHGGYYTQDDIREIVRYAADRHVRILPEIEMPGHARAAIAAYPELGCNPDTPLKPWTTWGVCPDIFVPTDRTVAFLQDVLSEVLELFPSRFIHVGGDEAIKNQWKASPLVQARIKELGLKNEAEMQSWLIHKMDTFLTERGRRLIGWDEILEGGLAPGAVVMSWRGEEGGIAAARSGHDVVMAPTARTYFDYYQGPPEKEPLAIGGNVPLQLVYDYDPVPKALNQDQARHILGSQGQLWAEYLPTTQHVEYMAFPRALALAEVLWTPLQRRNFEDFAQRLRTDLRVLDVVGVNYRAIDSR